MFARKKISCSEAKHFLAIPEIIFKLFEKMNQIAPPFLLDTPADFQII